MLLVEVGHEVRSVAQVHAEGPGAVPVVLETLVAGRGVIAPLSGPPAGGDADLRVLALQDHIERFGLELVPDGLRERGDALVVSVVAFQAEPVSAVPVDAAVAFRIVILPEHAGVDAREFLGPGGGQRRGLHVQTQGPVTFEREGDVAAVLLEVGHERVSLAFHRRELTGDTEVHGIVLLPAELELLTLVERNLRAFPDELAAHVAHIDILVPAAAVDGADHGPRVPARQFGGHRPVLDVQGHVPVAFDGKGDLLAALHEGARIGVGALHGGQRPVKAQDGGVAAGHPELEGLAEVERDAAPLPDELVSLVLHREILVGSAAADGAVHGPLVVVRPGFLAHRELAALLLGIHGDEGAALALDVLLGPHPQGDVARLAGLRLEFEPVDRAADEPVVGRVEIEDEFLPFRLEDRAVRLHRDGVDRRVGRVEFLFLDLVAGSGPQKDRCGCSEETYSVLFHISACKGIRE